MSDDTQRARARDLLFGAFEAGVAAVRAEALLPPHLPAVLDAVPPEGELIVVAIGKAAADMAACVETHAAARAGLRIRGFALTRHGHGTPTRQITVMEAGHPVPDDASQTAAQRILACVRQAQPHDHVLALLSGGGSSLLSLPHPGLSLADLQAVSRDLLASGASIAALNCVRKHLSQTLGGHLAAQCRAPVTALLLSDVVDDDPAVIASGPFSPDPTTYAEAEDLLRRFDIVPPAAVAHHLTEGRQGHRAETPKPGDPRFARIDSRIIGNGRTAQAGAAAWLRSQGIEVIEMGNMTGNATALARTLADTVLSAPRPTHSPVVWISGGESEVKLRASAPTLARGGRNGEFLLALAESLASRASFYALAADTDGIDGSGDNAGAWIHPGLIEAATAKSLSLEMALDRQDSYGFFSALGLLVRTGPTRTNANDLRLILRF
mgnify:CR=1 FL=1